VSFPTPWTVDVLRRSSGGTDAHGNPVTSYGDPETHRVYAIAPGGSTEPFEGNRDAVTWDLDVLSPAPIAEPQDRVVVAGDVYEVEGRPDDFTRGPFGWAPGYRIRLNRVEDL